MDMTGTQNKLDHAFDIQANIHPSASYFFISKNKMYPNHFCFYHMLLILYNFYFIDRLDCYRIWVNDWYLVAQISLEPGKRSITKSI
ncbi:uncharacterized protein DC041_0010108 [Schistosoma bovis]|uniref:Uncharacterized protein n=1 Tax=Schistosoma bovis TaxID=6184 RepID=A0A430Q6T8_SCHBO|nr:uncharacterized protein DC041_0010108 [Schistosoma bovis]